MSAAQRLAGLAVKGEKNMMITNGENIGSALKAWRDIKIAQSQTEQSEHLEERVLIRMAADGGLQDALENELEHLENCPLCLAAWSAWRRAFNVATKIEDEKEIDGDLFSDDAYGFLEAAATTSQKIQGLVIESSCGVYRLEVLPNRDQPKEGMIVLSRMSKNGDNKVTVRDKKGQEILSGTLENGRLARLCYNLNKLDLSLWTVMAK